MRSVALATFARPATPWRWISTPQPKASMALRNRAAPRAPIAVQHVEAPRHLIRWLPRQVRSSRELGASGSPALVDRLRALDWIEDGTVAIEYRRVEAGVERYTEIAVEFVRLKFDVMVITGGAVGAAKQAIDHPSIFAVASDPSPARHGGTSNERHPKGQTGPFRHQSRRSHPVRGRYVDYRDLGLARRRRGEGRKPQGRRAGP